MQAEEAFQFIEVESVMLTHRELLLAALAELRGQYESIRMDAAGIVEAVRQLRISLMDLEKRLKAFLEDPDGR